MDGTDDGALMQQIAAGSEAAFAMMYERHRRPVFAQGYVETGSRADAEEVLQDAFLTLWQKRRSVRLAGASALPWLLVTAKHLARNRRRYQARRAASELPVELSDAASDPARIAEQHELAALIDGALGGLEQIDQQIVQLCLVEGLSYQQAATRLRSTHATVRNRLSRARRSVRASLESETGKGCA